MEDLVLIDVELITCITGLPSWGENLTQYLNDKTKDKTYGTERGSCRIIIKCISDVETRLDTKLMVQKFLRKCRKEEVPVGVVVAASQCTWGTMLI